MYINAALAWRGASKADSWSLPDAGEFSASCVAGGGLAICMQLLRWKGGV